MTRGHFVSGALVGPGRIKLDGLPSRVHPTVIRLSIELLIRIMDHYS